MLDGLAAMRDLGCVEDTGGDEPGEKPAASLGCAVEARWLEDCGAGVVESCDGDEDDGGDEEEDEEDEDKKEDEEGRELSVEMDEPANPAAVLVERRSSSRDGPDPDDCRTPSASLARRVRLWLAPGTLAEGAVVSA